MADEKKSPVNKAGQVVDASVDKLAASLNKTTKGLPSLAAAQRQMVAKLYPWAAGLFALLGLVWAKDLWDAARTLDNVQEALGQYSSLFAAAIEKQYNSSFLYITAALFVLNAVLVGVALAKGGLQASRAAWKWFFKSALVTTLAAISLLIATKFDPYGKFWATLVMGLVGLYLLLQARSDFHS